MFESFTQAGCIHLTMSATLANIDEAEAHFCSFLADCDNLDVFAIRILLREALLNAVVHGSGEDASQVVTVEGRLESSGLVLTVSDHGPGFGWHLNTVDMNTLGEGGRGIPLMYIYASQVDFNQAGNQVTMYRYYENAPTTTAAEGVRS